jgi:hypothetical protein
MSRINFYHRNCDDCGYYDSEALYEDEKNDPCPSCGGKLSLKSDVSHLAGFKIFPEMNLGGVTLRSKAEKDAYFAQARKVDPGAELNVTHVTERQQQQRLDEQRHKVIKDFKAKGLDAKAKQFEQTSLKLDKKRKQAKGLA